MTVRQDGREIVCPLSAVTVFFCLSEIFQNRSKTVLFAWFNKNEKIRIRDRFCLCLPVCCKRISELVPHYDTNSGYDKRKSFSNTSKSVVFGWLNGYASKKFAKNFRQRLYFRDKCPWIDERIFYQTATSANFLSLW